MMKLKERFKYWKDVKSGNSIPLLWIDININKFRLNKEGSCKVNIHPVVIHNLESKQLELVKYHINQAIDIIKKDGIIEVEELI